MDLRSPEALGDDLGASRILKAAREAQEEMNRAVVLMMEAQKARLEFGSSGSVPQPWMLEVMQNIDPALRAAASGELPGWGKHVEQPTEQRGFGRRVKIYS